MGDALNPFSGPATWVMGVLLLVGFGGVGALLLTSARLSRRYPVKRVRVSCPGTGAETETLLVYDLKTRTWINVLSCGDSPSPRCERSCLKALNAT